MPGAHDVVTTVRAELTRSPAFVFTAVATALFLAVAPQSAGFRPTTWYPAALLTFGLLVVAVLALPRAQVSRLSAVATASLTAYAGWSYLSILWADQQGDAWDGANRTALYALVFALFTTWRIRARPAAWIVGGFALGVALIALIVLLAAAGADDPSSYFTRGRFSNPVGYQNGNVALWFMAFLPCAALAARREVHPLLRGAFAAGAVVLASLAILGESRGWAFAAPLTLIAYAAIVPQKVRAVLTLLVILGATALALPPLLDVYDAANGAGFGSSVADAARAVVLVAALAAAVVGAAAVADRRRRVSRIQARRAGAVLLVVAAVSLVAGAAVLFANEGSPSSIVSRAWNDFKTQGQPKEGEGPRFGVSLGSNRYDFWRVGLDRFKDEPLIGIGADNFQHDYLAARRSSEQPRYPHSIEIRALSQTGLIGAALLGLALGAALLAAIRAIRRRSGLGSAVAAAATGGFLYWLCHGSVDWFWEFAGLGAPAFALLGLAAGLEPRRPAAPRGARGRARPLMWAGAAAAVVAACALAWSLGAPWLSELQVDRATHEWRTDPNGALDRLESAASLNRLSSRPYLFAGSIAVRLDRPALARRYFREVLRRDPRDAFANLELGALEDAASRRRQAGRYLRRAEALNPRDVIAARAVQRFRKGQPVDIDTINAEYVKRTRGLVR